VNAFFLGNHFFPAPCEVRCEVHSIGKKTKAMSKSSDIVAAKKLRFAKKKTGKQKNW